VRTGVPIDEIVAYRWTGLAFVEIPVQVDERYQYCLSNPPSGFSFYSGTDKEITYAWDVESWKKTAGQCVAAMPTGDGPTPDPSARSTNDDEIVFMARDAGPQAPPPRPTLGPPGPPTAGLTLIDALARRSPAEVRPTLYLRPDGRRRLVFTAANATSRTDVRDETRTSGSTVSASRATIPRSSASATPTTVRTCRQRLPDRRVPGYPPDPDGTPRASTDRFVRDGVTVTTGRNEWRATGRWMVRGPPRREAGAAGRLRRRT
jgi:hypothetical protein